LKKFLNIHGMLQDIATIIREALKIPLNFVLKPLIRIVLIQIYNVVMSLSLSAAGVKTRFVLNIILHFSIIVTILLNKI
jgi:hypothetical protein